MPSPTPTATGGIRTSGTSLSTSLHAGVHPKVISERLGHATIAITMDTYSHVLPGMDERAASAVARLILGDETAPGEGAVSNP